MKKRWFIVFGIALVMLPVFLILVVRFKSPAEIMHPPSLYGKNAEIQNAFENSISDTGNIVLKYPLSGDYRTAFVMYDIDSDNEDEVVVFYSLKSDETTVRVNILDYIDGEWESVSDEAGYGSEIISVNFADLNHDNKTEIICCWSLYDSQSAKIMTVHSAANTASSPVQLKTLVNQSYSFMSVADMDNDKNDEIFVAWIDSTTEVPKSYATLLKMDDKGSIQQYGQKVTLDASISNYSSLKVETNGERPIAFLDAFKGEDSMITEIVWWDSEKGALVAPFLDKETLSNLITFRNPALFSRDIDDDGLIEIPTNMQSAYDLETSTSDWNEERIGLTLWSQVTPSGLQPKSYSFVNNDDNYSFTVEDSYKDRIIAFKQTDTKVMTVYSTPNGKEKGEPLFSLVLKKSSELKGNETYTFMKSNGEYTICGTLTSAGKDLGLSDQTIEKSLVFFE